MLFRSLRWETTASGFRTTPGGSSRIAFERTSHRRRDELPKPTARATSLAPATRASVLDSRRRTAPLVATGQRSLGPQGTERRTARTTCSSAEEGRPTPTANVEARTPTARKATTSRRRRATSRLRANRAMSGDRTRRRQRGSRRGGRRRELLARMGCRRRDRTSWSRRFRRAGDGGRGSSWSGR